MYFLRFKVSISDLVLYLHLTANMIKNWKINTAFLLCSVFIIRILLIGVISSVNAPQNRAIVKAHFSNSLKRRRYFHKLDDAKSVQVSAAEIFEQRSNNNKPYRPGLLSFLQQLFILAPLQSAHHYLLRAPCTSISRYHLFRVFRI